jgi:hypothetical protein
MPNYEIAADAADALILRDLGPWDRFPTITNAAEEVVEAVATQLHGRKLQYYDSEGELTELAVKDGRFAGFQFPGD